MTETTKQARQYKVGDPVVSDVYGAGNVVNAESEDGDQMVQVRFPNGLETWLFADSPGLALVGSAPAALDVPFALVPGGKAPVRATEGAAAVDLHARLTDDQWRITLPAATGRQEGDRFPPLVKAPVVAVPLGVRVAIPAGHVGLLFSRSSLGKKGLVIPNGVGVIDSDYRGEVSALLQNLSGEDVVIRDGERIAQIVIVPIPAVAFVAVDALDDTARGEGGFGSTGVGEIEGVKS